MSFDGFVCACCGAGIYDMEIMEIADSKAGKRYLICFDCAEKYTSEQSLARIRERYKASAGSCERCGNEPARTT